MVSPISLADLDGSRGYPEGEEAAGEGRLGEFALSRLVADQLSEKRDPNKV